MEEVPQPKCHRAKPGSARIRFRRFVFTLNNWTQVEYDSMQSFVQERCTWAVCGKEVGELGTPHLQGACCLKVQMSLQHIKTWGCFTRAHLEQMFGTPQDSLTYCTKQDRNAWIFGTMPNPGKRNDIAAALQDMHEGMKLKDMLADHGPAIVKFHRGLMIAKSLMEPPRDESEPPTVYWLHGATGTGKTKCAWEFARTVFPDSIWINNDTLQWFDGYSGEDAVIIDDFRNKHISFSFLLRITDRYELRVPFKGGFVCWRPSLIIITSPRSICDTFATRNTHIPEDIAQLERRITGSFDFDDGGGDLPSSPASGGSIPMGGRALFMGLLVTSLPEEESQ